MRAVGIAGLCCALALPAFSQSIGGYSGPSILSRGSRPGGRAGGNPVRFRGYASIGVGYTGGLTPVATDRQGQLFNGEGFGSFLGFGGYGARD